MVDRADLTDLEKEYGRYPEVPSGSDLFTRYQQARLTLKDALDCLAFAITEREAETKRADAAESKLEERD